MPISFGRRAAGALAAGAAQAAAAQDWPTRPVRIVVPFTPGGSNDAMARPLAERLQARFGQPFVVENRAGAGSAVGVGLVAQAPPDGLTLLVTTSSVAAIGPVQQLPFDPVAALDGVALIARAPMIVLVPAASRFATLPDLLAEARAHPGELSYASSGPGSTVHLASEWLCLRAGVRLQHVPYRGTAGALTDLVAGRVDVMVTAVASANGQLQAGLLRPLAYTEADRPPGSPPAPTARDLGIDYEFGIWWGLFGPRGLPPAVLARLNAAVNAALADPAFARYLAGEGAIPLPLSPAAFDRMLRAEASAMRELVAAARIRAD